MTDTRTHRLADLQGPDGETDETVVIVHIAGGLLADVGARRADLPRLRVVVIDEDVLEDGDGESDGVWQEGVTDLHDWSRDENDALVRAAGELPESLRLELGLVGPE